MNEYDHGENNAYEGSAFSASELDKHKKHYAVSEVAQVKWCDDVIPKHLLFEIQKLLHDVNLVPSFYSEGDSCAHHEHSKHT